ncbi:MAG: helix-turn-helix transcriptional regulator [Bacilli bacterium]|nr:helix-turn-helix transcriptional regulator [Bacilli bacterium]
MKSSVVVYVDYGEIKVNIKRIMKEKGITRQQLIKRTGLTSRTINRYYNDEVLKFDRDVLAKLCHILDCSLDDLIYYKKSKK